MLASETETRASSVTSSHISSSTLCNVELDGIETKALVDTGSGVCLISEKFRAAHDILKNRKLHQNVLLRATSVNNEPVDLIGVLDINIRIGKQDIRFPFYVARNVTFPALLGWDFMQSTGMMINGQKGELLLRGEVIPLLPQWRAFPRVCSATMMETEVIPARTEIVVRASLEPARKADVVLDGFSGVLDPAGVFKNDDGLLENVFSFCIPKSPTDRQKCWCSIHGHGMIYRKNECRDIRIDCTVGLKYLNTQSQTNKSDARRRPM